MAIDRTKFQVEGLTTVIENLQRKSYVYNRRRISNVMRAETGDLRKQMKALAPKDDGDLRKSISTVTKINIFGIRSKVGPRLKKAWYAHFIELGTKAHTIKQRPHPGTDAQPYVKPVYEANKRTLPVIIYRAVKRIMKLT